MSLSPLGYNDNGYRPAHIHFNVTANGYPQLITQLYFSNDYYLSSRDSCSICKIFIIEENNELSMDFLGHSDLQSLQVSTYHHQDIKTFEGDWTIVLSRRTRTALPSSFRSNTPRGSYIHVQEHIMNS